MGSQRLGPDSGGDLWKASSATRCLKIQKYGRLWPWPIISKKFKSFQIPSLVALTFAGCQAIKSTAADNPQLLGLKSVSTKFVELSTQKTARLSGSTSVRSQVSTSMESLLALVLQTKSESMQNLEM